MDAFTPGPWGLHVYRDPEWGVDMAMISIGSRAHIIGHTDLSKANALLIAAAPDLYEALKEMLEYAGIIEERCDSVATNKARAAIAKAEGEA